MAVQLLDSLRALCPYDSAAALFTDVNGEITGWYSVNIRDEFLNMTAEFYVDLIKGVSPTLYEQPPKSESEGGRFSQRVDWTQERNESFKHDFLQAIGVSHSWYFCFFDMLGIPRIHFIVNRADDEPFAQEECEPLELALPVLNNMHRNFFYQGRDTQGGDIKDSWGAFSLTRRETEVADLLCQGMSIKTVASVLFISVSTVYQHLANIYKKTNVSSQHELVAKLLAGQRAG